MADQVRADLLLVFDERGITGHRSSFTLRPV